MKKILLMLVIILSTISTQARKFYFNASGSDSYTTTQAQNPATPWKTLAKVSSVANGDSALFAKGSRFSGSMTLQSRSNIYFGTYGTGADPLFWGNGSTISQLFTLRGCTNITFYGWNISDTTISNTDRLVQAKIQTVFKIESSSTGIVIRKCRMDRIGYGAYITSSSRGQTMDSNDIGNLRMIRNTPTSVNNDDDYGGVPVQISSRNNIFTNNYLHDCWSQSYDYGNDGGGVEFFEEGDTIKGNRIMYNTFYDCNGTFEFGSSPNGVAGNPQVDNIIAYNKIINSSSLFYINNLGQYKTEVRNLQFYNNIIVQTVTSRNGTLRMMNMADTNSTSGIVVLKNNIFQISNGASVARVDRFNGVQLVHTNNIFKLSNGGVLNFTLGATERSTTANIWVDTTDANPLNWNYNLLPSASYAIDNGVDVGLTRDFGGNIVGSTPSIGIYQYTTSASPLRATSTYSAILCNGGNSTVTVSATGGTPPYTGVGTFSRTAGSYVYTVTDSVQASSTTTGSIPQPAAITGTVNFINGTATTITANVTAIGGTSPYTYSINGTGIIVTSQVSNLFIGVPYGSGTITITDANSCQYTTSYTINSVGVTPPTGRTFYVSNSGSDSYTTTQAQNPSTPWATLSKVQSSLGSFTSGDRILFAKRSRFSGSMTIQSKSNIYFGTYGTGADPLFWGNGSTISQLFTLRGCTNITFYGLNISDTTISNTDRTIPAKIQTVFKIESSTTGTVIRKCRMDRIGYGAYITRTSPGQTMDSCDIGNLRMIRNTPTSVNADDDYGGVPVQLSSSSNTVTNNYFHDCYSVSYDYGRDGGGIEFFEEGSIIENNIIAYNTFYECNGVFEFGSSNNSIADNLIQNNKIYYNKIINNNTVFYINNSGQYKTEVRNLQFYNNVMLQTVPNANPVGSSGIMFSLATSDATAGIIVLKNNIIQVSNGLSLTRSGQLTGTNLTHTNNIYKLSGGTVANFTLDGTERGSTGNTWVDTTNANPLNWNYNLLPSASYAIGNGVNVGLTRDFGGNIVGSTPSIGVYNSAASDSCSFTYGAWTTCIDNSQTRTYTSTPAGCTGTPDADSLTQSCVSTPCSFTYGAWTTCSNGNQTRTYTSTPAYCTGTPDSSLTRSCVVPTCSFTYSAWSTCTNGTQARTYSSTPTGCVGSPRADSLSRTCTVTVVISKFSYREKRISITCNVSGTMIIRRGNTVVRTVNYPAGATTVSVSALAVGTYTASTYGSTITFKR